MSKKYENEQMKYCSNRMRLTIYDDDFLVSNKLLFCAVNSFKCLAIKVDLGVGVGPCDGESL
jgi:hypothetical protein